jgi:hypothetical protein
MDTDIEILKTLESIEKLLRGASASTGTGRMPTSAARTKKASDRAGDREQGRVFKATTDNLGKMNETVMGLDRSLVGLNTEVGKTTVSFSSLTSSMGKFMASLAPIDIPTAAPITDGAVHGPNIVGWLEAILNGQTRATSLSSHWSEVASIWAETGHKRAGFISDQVNLVIHELRLIEKNVRRLQTTPAVVSPIVNVAPPTTPTPTVNVTVPTAPIVGTAPAPQPSPLQPLTRAVPPLTTAIDQLLGRFGKTSNKLELFGSMVGHLKDAVKKVAEDFFSLAHVGLGSSQNLLSLSKFALQSGMSLKEYASVVSDNVTAASRAGSLDNFNKLISAADGQLAAMGVFGKDARELQGSLAQTNTMMGVSQANLGDAITGQIKLFDKLRKSTNMTAKEFSKLVESVSENDQVQSELVGLQGQERSKRRQDMLALAGFGQTIGMTAEASKRLADAMIEARGQTVKSRMEESGRIRQMAQFLGMGSKGERAAQLSMKGRNRTKDEDLEFRQLAQDMETSAQAAYQNGSLGAQAVLDQLQEFIGQSGFGKEMKASKQAALVQDSGAVNNRDFGQHVGKFGQFVGELLKYVKGFNESIGPSILGAVTAGTLLLFKGPIVKALGAGLAKIPGLQGLATGGAATAGAAATGATGAGLGTTIMTGFKNVMTADIFAPIKNVIPMIQSLGKTITGIGPAIVKGVSAFGRNLFNAAEFVKMMNGTSGALQTVKFMTQEFGGSIIRGAKVAGEAISSGFTTVRGALSGMAGGFVLWGGIIGAAVEMFTGEVSNVLDPGGGFFARIGGMVTAFFTALPNMFFDIIGFVFGEKFIARYRNSFDTIVATVNMAFKEFLGSLVGGVAGILKKILPDDSKLVKFLDTAAEDLFISAAKNEKVRDELWNDNSKTFASISEANAKAADEKAKKAETATTRAVAAQAKYDNVQYGLNVTRDSVLSDAKAVLGQPQVQVPQAVNPGTVNSAAAEDTQKRTDTAQQAIAAVGSPEILAALNSMLALMRESLNQEQRQVALTEQLVKGNRPAAGFVSAEVMANRLLNQGQV